MKKIILKTIGLFMTVFVVSGFGHGEKAHGTLPELNGRENASLTTTTHGGGCGCACCMKPAETSAQDSPA